ncbi:hypothetical protein TI04_10245, partial [Achromatium sp. WMS2]
TKAFVKYLLGQEAQEDLLKYGFRPANPQVSFANHPISKYFNNDIEIGDAPKKQQTLRDLWEIVKDMPKAQAVRF